MRNRALPAIYWSGLVLALVCSPTLLTAQTHNPSPLMTSPSSPPPLDPYGNCAAPSTEGVTICQPPASSTINAPFQVIAAGVSGLAAVDHFELWADGKKITQTPGSPFDEAVTLDPGTHQLTLIEVDQLYSYAKSTPISVTVNSIDNEDCSPPGSPGVNVCEPQANGCNTQPWVQFLAAGKGASGTVNHMELWISGTKIANFPGNHFDTNIIVYGTDYNVSIDEVDSKGNTLGKSFTFSGPC